MGSAISAISAILGRILNLTHSVDEDLTSSPHRPTPEQLHELSQATGFSARQLRRFYNRFAILDTDSVGYLDQAHLKSVDELGGGEQNPLGDRMIEVLLNNYGTDGKRIDFGQFVRVLAIFRRRTASENPDQFNSRRNKLRFIFNVYDKNRDERISRDDLLAILDLMVQFRYPDDMDKAEKDKEEKNRECLLVAIMSRMVEEFETKPDKKSNDSNNNEQSASSSSHHGQNDAQITFDMFCRALEYAGR